LQSVAPSGTSATTPGGKLQEPISVTLEVYDGKENGDVQEVKARPGWAEAIRGHS
jgi:hypothetical protein